MNLCIENYKAVSVVFVSNYLKKFKGDMKTISATVEGIIKSRSIFFMHIPLDNNLFSLFLSFSVSSKFNVSHQSALPPSS